MICSMSLKKSVILALSVIIVLAVAAGLIAYNFRAAMFDRNMSVQAPPAAETVSAPSSAPVSPEAAITDDTKEGSSPLPILETEEQREKESGGIAVLEITGNEEGSPKEETITVSEETDSQIISEEEEEANQIPAVTKEYDIYGYMLSATIGNGTAELSYPEWIDQSDVEAFFSYENEKHDLAGMGMSYTIQAPGSALILLPENMGIKEAEESLDILADDLVSYLAPAEEENTEDIPVLLSVDTDESVMDGIGPIPVQETTEDLEQYADESIYTPALAEEEPAETIADEEDSPFEFTLFFKGGILAGFDGVPLPEAGIGLDFKNIITMGDTVGIGLRSDIAIDLVPTMITGADMNRKALQPTTILVCPVLGSFDLKLMLNADLGFADIFFGGGLGAAAGADVAHTKASSYLGYGPFSILGGEFRADWFASAIAGVRCTITDFFSLGAKAGYRYIIKAEKHVLSAAVAFGFSF